MAKNIQQAEQKPPAEPVSQQIPEVREPENIKNQQEEKAEPKAVEETVEHDPPKAEKGRACT